ncbi:MAG: hypothetical protein K8R36_12950 [Planctomycetales bacterium]|nr:hypothetical protein [Planctomycetales bacterium]
MSRYLMSLLLAAVSLVLVADDVVKPAADSGLDAQKGQLAKLQGLVGSWKGVASPIRGSDKGAWIEKADWAWKFSDKSASLVVQIADGKYFSTGELRPGNKAGDFVLAAKSADGKQTFHYEGQLDKEEKLTLIAKDPPESMPRRISFRFVAEGARLIVLLEGPSAIGDGYARLAEVGYTRKGSNFGKGSTGPECVVTGGYGSIQVAYKGQKYFVCCTGCRDYFNDNPEEVLADYKARKEAEKLKKEKE